MIFVATGHCVPFPRLIEHVDELSAQLDEPVVQQIGRSDKPKHSRSFDYESSLQPHFREARLVIAHAGMGTAMEVLKMGKPLILVPRQHQFAEHFDNHQVETAEKMHERFGLKYILDIDELTLDVLKQYSYVAPWTEEPLQRFRRAVLSFFMST